MTGVDGQDFARAEVAKGGNWIATVRQDWPTIATTLADIIDAHFAGTGSGRVDRLRSRCGPDGRERAVTLRTPLIDRPAHPRHVSARGAALGIDIGTTSVKAGLLWLDEDGPDGGRQPTSSVGTTSTRMG